MSQRFVSQKYNNTEYAPGIALYGIDGKDGLSGISGTSIFVSQYDCTEANENDLRDFGNNIRQNKMMIKNSDEFMNRPYTKGDAFIFPNGYIYKIENLDKLLQSVDNLSYKTFNECMKLAGQIVFSSSDDKFSPYENRMVLDTTNYKGFVINMSSELPDKVEAPMTIVSDSAGNDDLIRFIDMKSIQTGQSDV